MATETKLVLETVVKGTSASRKALASFQKAVKGISTQAKKTQKTVKKFGGSMKNLSGTFQNLRNVGVIAFTAVSAGIGKMTKDAAEAEGTWNKFNAVFGDTKDDMADFITDIRKRMPVATDDIARMAADLQDLLVPLGLTRELGADMTKGFLEVSNAIGAFNDVNPTEVLDAIKSGLTGSSMPLKRFGVDASVSALEAIAMSEGLLKAGESFAKLEPAVRNQIRAQALLVQIQTQSSDAINGFAENADSLIFRQLELRASVSDLSGELGKVFIPIVDSVVKKLIPLVKTFTEWAGKNPELIKQIATMALGITGLLVVVGTLGLVIPALVSGFTAMITVVKLLGVALRFLALNPIGLVIVAIAAGIAIGILIVKNWDLIKEKAVELGIWLFNLAEKWGFLLGPIGLIIQIGAKVIKNWDTIKETAIKLGIKLKETWLSIQTGVSGSLNSILTNSKEKWEKIKTVTTEFVTSMADVISEKFTAIVDGIKSKINGVINFFKKAIDKIKKLGGAATDFFSGDSGIDGARAKGGPVNRGGTFLVGEKGPELFTPGQNGQIIPNNKLSGGGSNIEINISGVFGSDAVDEIGDQIVNRLKLAVAI